MILKNKTPMKTEDPRKTGLKNGLRQLTVEELRRVLDYPGEMLVDTYNYHDGKFCPLGIALELDRKLADPTNEKVIKLLEILGYKIFNTRGIQGEFYTTDRQRDLRIAAEEVLQELRGIE